MKFSGIGVLSLVLALNGVIAAPLQARHYDVETVVHVETRTVYLTSTCWADPSAPTTATSPPPKPKQKDEPKNYDVPNTPSVSISKTLATPTVSSSDSSVVPSSTLAYTSVETTQQTTLSTTSRSLETLPTTTSSTTSTSTTSWTSTTPAPPPTTPTAPTTIPPVPIAEPSTSKAPKAEPTTAAPSPSPAVYAGTGGGSSTVYTGDGTFYDVGMGSCGLTNTNSEYIVALSHLFMAQKGTANPNKNGYCGKAIICSYKGGPKIRAIIVDTCQGCAIHDIDLSPAAYRATGATDSQGRVPMEWSLE